MCPERLGPSAARGMTLIELMIVVAVVALLGMVALPAYQNSVRKAHRADAKAALTVGAQRLERYFTEHNGYTGATVGPNPTVHTLPDRSENGYYQLSLVPTATTYLLTAAPLVPGPQESDACGTFSINQNGDTDVSGGSLSRADCW